MRRKEIEFMKIKNTIKRFSGILFAMVLAAAFLLPAQAATNGYVTYKWNKGYTQKSGNTTRAVTEGGSAYDDRGNACNAKLVAGVKSPYVTNYSYGYRNFTGSTTAKAYSPYLENANRYIHNCTAR